MIIENSMPIPNNLTNDNLLIHIFYGLAANLVRLYYLIF